MKKLLRILMLFAMLSPMPPDRALAQCTRPTPSRNVGFVLTRTCPDKPSPITPDNIRPLIAYMDVSDKAIDWLFDGLIIADCALSYDVNENPPKDTAMQEYETAIFDNGQLTAVADAVRALRAELGDPSYRLKIHLSANSTTANLSTGPGSPGRLIERFRNLGRDELELVGFYWSLREDTYGPVGVLEDTAHVAAIRRLADFLHNRCLELIWAPIFNSSALNHWPSYGLDRVVLQPNYFSAGEGVGPERLLDADTKISGFGLAGAVMELEVPANPDVKRWANPITRWQSPVLLSARAYLAAADAYNWGQHSLNVFFYGPWIANFVQRAGYREVYDGIYRLTAANPRSSRLNRTRLLAVSDTFTEALHPTTQHGTEQRLVVGSNLASSGPPVIRPPLNIWPTGLGNHFHSYLRFDLPSQISGDLLSAKLWLTVQDFPNGSDLNDLELRLAESDGLSEAFTWHTEHSCEHENDIYLQAVVNSHRVIRGAPPAHSFDVTTQIQTALALGKKTVWFVLRRRTEDYRAAQVIFYSRESPRGPTIMGPRGSPIVMDSKWNPTLELIVRP